MGYWQKRMAEELAAITDKTQEETQEQLIKVYKRAAKKAMKEFENLYNEVLAKVAKGKQPSVSLLYGMDKYYQQQAALKEILQQLGDKQIAVLSEEFEKQYKHVYQAIVIDNNDQVIAAMVGDKAFSTVDAKSAVNYIWCNDGKHFSKRVWENLEDLGATLNEELLNCVITGKKTSELQKRLMERFNVSYNRANTIVRTETARIQIQASKDRYKDYGIEEYEVLVKVDKGTCDVCAKFKGKRFKLADMQIGVNAPPFHPNCRDDIIPVVETAKKKQVEYLKCSYCGIVRSTDTEYCPNCGKKRSQALYKAQSEEAIVQKQQKPDNRWLDSIKKAGYTYDKKSDSIHNTTESDKMIEYNFLNPTDNLMYYCIDCGKPFYTKTRKSTAQMRCPECQEKYRRAYKAQKEKERRERNKNK